MGRQPEEPDHHGGTTHHSEVIHIHERNPWSKKTDKELLILSFFIEKCGDRLPHKLLVEQYRRMKMGRPFYNFLLPPDTNPPPKK